MGYFSDRDNLHCYDIEPFIDAIHSMLDGHICPLEGPQNLKFWIFFSINDFFALYFEVSISTNPLPIIICSSAMVKLELNSSPHPPKEYLAETSPHPNKLASCTLEYQHFEMSITSCR